MSHRRRQWLAVLITASLVVSMLIGWGGYLRARATPHYVQTTPGASATPGHENNTSMRLASLTVTPPGPGSLSVRLHPVARIRIASAARVVRRSAVT